MTFWTFGREGGTRRGGRLRFVAAFCAVLMLIGALGMQAMAAPPLGEVAYPWSENHPLITVEGNAVMTKSGQLTGFFELALKVQTVRYYTDSTYSTEITKQQYIDGGAIGAKREHRFLSAAAALRFNTDLLTPVAWWVASVPYTGANSAPDSYDDGVIDVAGSFMSLTPPLQEFHQISMDTQKADGNISASATISNYNDTEKSALLSLWAEAGNSANGGVMFDDSTAVVVVRFAYNKTAYAEEMKTGAHSPYLMRNADAAVALLTTNTPNSAVWFAADNQLVYSDNSQSIWYTGTPSNAPIAADDEKTAFYYTAIDSSSVTNVPDPADTGDPVTKFIPKPNTSGWTALSKKIGPPLEYSYLQHMLKVTVGTTPAPAGPNDEVIFTHVNKPSHLTTGINADNMLTILFYDWDDTLIGTRVVERGDVREDVNSYIESTFIHPDLRASDPANAGNPSYTDSLARAYSYRGEFDSSPGSGTGAVTDGEDFPLTNKLDYVFYKRVTTMSEDTAVSAPDFARYWSTEPVSAAAPGDPTFPYVYGWAVIDNMKDIKNVWTTFGVGELLDADPAASTPLPPTAAVPGGPTDYAFKTSSADETGYFRLADFADLENRTAYPGPFLAVKAVYEEGDSLLAAGDPYTLTRPARYTRYNDTDSTTNGAYSVQFAYSRYLSDGGIIKGVPRIREIGVRAQFTPDLMKSGIDNTQSKPFYEKVDVLNREIVDVDIILAGGIYAVDYTLMEMYGENVVAGTDRSTVNATQIEPVPTNFIYSSAANAYTERQGTPGFVLLATLSVLNEQGTLAAQALPENLVGHASKATIDDLNLRRDAGGTEYTAVNYTAAAPLIRTATAAAYAAGWIDTVTGNTDLSWHEMQYALINGGSLPGTRDNSMTTPVNLYSWCRIHDDCMALNTVPMDTVEQLFTIMMNYGSDPGALDNKTMADVLKFNFSKDASGTPFASVSEFSAYMQLVYSAAGSAGLGGSSSGIKWSQIQYALLTGTFPTSAVSEPIGKASYWWRGGGAKVTNWNGLFSAAAAAKMIAAGHVGESYPDWTAALDTAAANFQTTAVGRSLADNTETVITNFADFKSALIPAAADLAAAGYAAPTWDQVQYYILHGGAVVDNATALAESKEDYWWLDGGQKLSPTSTLVELLTAVQSARSSGRNAGLNTLVLADMIANPNLGFKATFQGGDFASETDFTQAMVGIAGHVNFTSALSWNRTQYALLRYAFDGTVNVAGVGTADPEGNSYYWWHNTAARNAVPFTGTDRDTLITNLIEGAYRAVTNGNNSVYPWNNLAGLSSTDFETFMGAARLINGTYIGGTDFGGQPFGTASDLISKLETLVGDWIAAQLPHPDAAPPKPAFTWEQVQNYLFTGDITDSTSGDPTYGYWWDDGTNINPDNATDPMMLFDEMLGLIYDAIVNTTAGDYAAPEWIAFEAFMTPDNLRALGFYDYVNGTDYDQNFIDENWAGWYYEYLIWDDGGVWGPFVGAGTMDLTWYQIMFTLAQYWTDDGANCQTDVESWGIYAPSWYIGPFSAPFLLPMSIEEDMGDGALFGTVPVTSTVTTIVSGVVIIETVTVTETPIETGIVTVTVVTTTRVYPDGKTETTTETETVFSPYPAPVVREDSSAAPQNDRGESPQNDKGTTGEKLTEEGTATQEKDMGVGELPGDEVIEIVGFAPELVQAMARLAAKKQTAAATGAAFLPSVIQSNAKNPRADEVGKREGLSPVAQDNKGESPQNAEGTTRKKLQEEEVIEIVGFAPELVRAMVRFVAKKKQLTAVVSGAASPPPVIQSNAKDPGAGEAGKCEGPSVVPQDDMGNNTQAELVNPIENNQKEAWESPPLKVDSPMGKRVQFKNTTMGAAKPTVLYLAKYQQANGQPTMDMQVFSLESETRRRWSVPAA